MQERDVYVFVNAFGRLRDLDLGDVVVRALAGEEKVLPSGWRPGEEVYLDGVGGEDAVVDGAAMRVYPALRRLRLAGAVTMIVPRTREALPAAEGRPMH